jgi:preprotein translocase subunit SecB
MADNENVQPQFAVKQFFIKDLSFEAPQGVAAFSNKWQPSFSVELNTKNSKVSDNTYEVILTVTITAKNNEETVFLIEVQQAGLFNAVGLAEENLRGALGVLAPSLLFPFVREVVDSTAIKGGFPPVNMQPVNFEALYIQAQQAKAKKEEAAPTETH